MPGGIAQLALRGQFDDYIFNNPEISFYKFVYKRHANFSMDNISLNFDNINCSISTMHSTTYTCKIIKENIDLLSKLYFIYTLPDIYSDDVFKFKWVENIGCLIIKDATIFFDDKQIDYITGEWLIIWNELTMPVKDSFNEITGNIKELTNPSTGKNIIRINNNIYSTFDYPSANINSGIPSIKGRKISVPLPFWFSKNPSLAIPILNFSSSITITFRINLQNIENLYVIYSDILNMHISPNYYNLLYNTKISIKKFINDENINPYLEATYVLLDNDERIELKKTATRHILFETMDMISNDIGIGGDGSIRSIDMLSKFPVKELIWTLKRTDTIDKFNDVLNYTNSIPKNNENSIMNTAKINWKTVGNNYMRVDEKGAYYFNNIQPYENHSCIPRQGIYNYSFSIYPEKWFPTGSYNSSLIGSSLYFSVNNVNNSNIDRLLIANNKQTYTDTINYKINLYTIRYNIIVIAGGDVGLKFSL